jgi:hypothetical protein
MCYRRDPRRRKKPDAHPRLCNYHCSVAHWLCHFHQLRARGAAQLCALDAQADPEAQYAAECTDRMRSVGIEYPASPSSDTPTESAGRCGVLLLRRLVAGRGAVERAAREIARETVRREAHSGLLSPFFL